MSFVPQIVQPTSKHVAGAVVTVTRPNNVTAYAAAQVYGPAADARISLVVPAVPADAMGGGFTGLLLCMVQNVVSTQGTFAGNLALFSSLPATTLGDQAAFNLSDADIAKCYLLPGQGQAFSFGSSAQNIVNNGAGTAGRRATQPVTLSLLQGSSVIIAGASTLGLYLVANAAYTPLALEAVQIFPYWSYAPLSL